MKKTILITGASTGIGQATAIYFADKNWNVIATMRNPEARDSTLNHPNITCMTLDVTDSHSIHAAIEESIKQFGKIDVLLNNAGYGLFGPLEALSNEQIDRQLQTNLYGVLHTMRAIIPHMRERKDGTIINVSSIAGRMTFPFTSVYHATKYAVEGLSEAFRYEVEQHGIRVKIIEPGGIKTNFIHRSSVFVKHPSYEPQASRYEALCTDDSSWADPREVAIVIYKAATDNSNRLRYLAKPGPFYFLYNIMPDIVWRAFGRFMLNKDLPQRKSH